MTGPHSETESPGTRPISVAELLARNGTIGEPAVTRRRRRRRGDSEAVTVAELTGELPIIRDDDDDHDHDAPDETEHGADGSVQVAEAATQAPAEPKPEPRWPQSAPRSQRVGPELSAYPRPLRRTDPGVAKRTTGRPLRPGSQSDAEDMSPDPLDQYADLPVDVMGSEVREAEPETEDSAYVRSYLQASDSTLFGGQTLADEVARRRGEERAAASADAQATEADSDEDLVAVEPRRTEPRRAEQAAEAHPGKFEAFWRGSLTVLQSILAVAFGAGLFIAFDQLWRWNSLVALVLSVLVILGLVAGVRVVRKTEDIASTLIAVAVGALITLGPLALSLQSG